MTQRAFVTGATGLLGRQVYKAFERAGYEVVGTGFSRASPPQIRKLDIQDENEVIKVLDEVKPHVVVHCAADRQPDSCTSNPAAARKLNVSATRTLAQYCSQNDIFLLYISTDYVFPGQPGEAPYSTTSPPNPPNVYGETKLEGEKEVLSFQSKSNKDFVASAVVLRVPVLYGTTSPKENNKESAVNVILDALWKINKGEVSSIKMDDYAIRYPTNTEDVARVCVDIVKLYTSPSQSEGEAKGEEKKGTLPRILQFSSEDKMTKYEIMKVLAEEVMGLSMEGVVADQESGRKPAADGTLRPYDCHLSTAELKRLGIDVSTMDFVAWWRRYVGAFRR